MSFELKNLMFCSGVIVCVTLLISTMPAALTDVTMQEKDYTFYGVNLGSFADSQEIRFNSTDFTTDAGDYLVYAWTIETPAADYVFVSFIDDRGATIDWIKIGVKIVFLNVWLDTRWAEWVNSSGYNYGDNFTYAEMSVEDPSDHEIETLFTLQVPDHPELTSVLYFFGINEGAYGAMMCLINKDGVGLHGFGTNTNETLQTSNGFAFFLQLLTFQAPNVHPWVNVLVWLAIGLPSAFVIYELIRSLIPGLG